MVTPRAFSYITQKLELVSGDWHHPIAHLVPLLSSTRTDAQLSSPIVSCWQGVGVCALGVFWGGGSCLWLSAYMAPWSTYQGNEASTSANARQAYTVWVWERGRGSRTASAVSHELRLLLSITHTCGLANSCWVTYLLYGVSTGWMLFSLCIKQSRRYKKSIHFK